MNRWMRLTTPLCELTLASDGAGLVQLSMDGQGNARVPAGDEGSDAVLEEAAAQLAAYFAGDLVAFELPLTPRGTDFQRTVWAELVRIPFGETATYAELAARIGRPSAVRAVARANATNPIGIVVPCHRVIGADGKLRGYAGGLERKSWLLEHEMRMAGTALV